MEILKENSDFLRHPLMSELVTEASNVSEDAAQLIKFHGSYQQDNRDQRTRGEGKRYQFMMRTRQPAGLVTNQLYLTMDDLANQVAPHPTSSHTQRCNLRLRLPAFNSHLTASLSSKAKIWGEIVQSLYIPLQSPK